jgi:hypothetical protein
MRLLDRGLNQSEVSRRLKVVKGNGGALGARIPPARNGRLSEGWARRPQAPVSQATGNDWENCCWKGQKCWDMKRPYGPAREWLI